MVETNKMPEGKRDKVIWFWGRDQGKKRSRIQNVQ